MNSTQFKGKYEVFKGKLKQKYANLTNDDLMYEEGKEDEFIGRIHEKTGESKQKLKDWVSGL